MTSSTPSPPDRREQRRRRHARQARTLGLRYVAAKDLSVRRRRRGSGFSYQNDGGRQLREPEAVSRIRSLAIPPAWTHVHIAAHPDDHIQAVGRDQAGRLQYIYHERWKTLREWRKIRRLLVFGEALSRVRAGIRRDLRAPSGSRQLAVAVGAALIDASAIRIGGERHYRRTGACGAVTLRRSHVVLNGRTVHLAFPAKGGKTFQCDLRSPHLLRPLERLRRLPGRRLLVYEGESGDLIPLSARTLNSYLTELAGHRVSAKDFRTFQATALAGDLLSELEPAQSAAVRNRQITEVMRQVADVLGNTPAMVRSNYVHGVVLDCFAAGGLAERWNRSGRRPRYLEPHEAALNRLLGGLDIPERVTAGAEDR